MSAAIETHLQPLDRHALEQIVTRSSEAVLLLDAGDPGMPIVYVNPAFESMTGFTAREVVGHPWKTLQRDQEGRAELDALRAAARRAEAVDVDLPDLRKDGSTWSSRISFSPLHDARGEVRFFLVLQRAAAAPRSEGSADEAGATLRRPAHLLREAPPPLQRAAVLKTLQKPDYAGRVDPVTGLLAFEHFLDVLNRDLAIARRERRAVTFMLFQIVELDVYRGTFGQKAAESALRMIGAQIGGMFRRAGDLCARYDDAVIAASVLGQEPAQAGTLIERVVGNVQGLKLHNPHGLSGRYIGVTSAVTGGVPGPGDDAEALLEQARSQLGA